MSDEAIMEMFGNYARTVGAILSQAMAQIPAEPERA